MRERRKKYIFISQTDHSNLASFITDDGGLTYNLCHFWSNFENADLDIFIGEQEYCNALDATGNFFYERWGDAPVHSIYVALVLQPSEIMFLDTVGY
ncbi:glycosyl transferase, partial [Lipomyces doorenjongii]